jgi:hypothetical protein
MRWLAAATLVLTGCVSQPNTYMPAQTRKPLDQHRPEDFPASLDLAPEPQTRRVVRLNGSGGAQLVARLTAATPANVRWIVNARTVGEAACSGDCAITMAIPSGTILDGITTLVEYRSSAPVVLTHVEIGR